MFVEVQRENIRYNDVREVIWTFKEFIYWTQKEQNIPKYLEFTKNLI